MKHVYIVVPNWKENNTECLLIEYIDPTQQDEELCDVQVLYVDREEYQIVYEMVKLIYDERKLYEPQNTLPV